MVGRGALTAASVGPIFSAPSVNSIIEAIRAVTGKKGCLIVCKNYLGNRLNVSIAAKIARREGLNVEVVHVTDDIAASLVSTSGEIDFCQARSIAGCQLLSQS